LSEGINRLRTQKSEMFLPFFLSLAAELEVESARIDAGLSMIDAAIAEADRIGERHYDAESHRIRGEILMKRDPTNAAPAEEAFQTAIAIAQQQKARSFELRAALDLARLWRSQGKPQQARELLASVYGWFTEGFDTRDLKEAKALLEELAA
jgi:predicted ATPase